MEIINEIKKISLEENEILVITFNDEELTPDEVYLSYQHIYKTLREIAPDIVNKTLMINSKFELNTTQKNEITKYFNLTDDIRPLR